MGGWVGGKKDVPARNLLHAHVALHVALLVAVDVPDHLEDTIDRLYRWVGGWVGGLCAGRVEEIEAVRTRCWSLWWVGG